MNTQITLEDEEALDPIDDIWQEAESSNNDDDNKAPKYKLDKKNLTRPYVAYEPLNNNCDSLKTWSMKRFHFMLAERIKFKLSKALKKLLRHESSAGCSFIF